MITIVLGACKPSAHFEAPIKELFASDQIRTYAFYPSTLRMINLSDNQALDSIASDINKLLIFRLDSQAQAQEKQLQIPEMYLPLGFDEYMSMEGDMARAALYGHASSETSTMVGYWSDTNSTLAFYLDGNINWMKVPKIMEAFRKGEVANILSPN